MVVPLNISTTGNPWLFKQIILNFCTKNQSICLIKVELDIFSKSTTIIVSSSSWVTERFKNRIGCKDSLLHFWFVWINILRPKWGKKLHTLFSTLCFSCSWFTRNHNSLACLCHCHLLMSIRWYGVNMRRQRFHYCMKIANCFNYLFVVLNNWIWVFILHTFEWVYG